jgi:hypothetical protein
VTPRPAEADRSLAPLGENPVFRVVWLGPPLALGAGLLAWSPRDPGLGETLVTAVLLLVAAAWLGLATPPAGDG